VTKNQNKSLAVGIIQAFTTSILATSLTPSSSENEWFVEPVKRYRWLQHRENHREDGDCTGGARRRLGTASPINTGQFVVGADHHAANHYVLVDNLCPTSQ